MKTTMRRRVSRTSSGTRHSSAARGFALLVAGGLTVGAAPLDAQDPAVARRNLRLPLPEFFEGPNTYWSVPAMGANTPGGFGAGWGDFYIGLGGTSRARFQNEDREDADAAAAFGLGFGNPVKTIGFEVTVNSYSTFEHEYLNRAGIDFRLHRQFGDFSAAIGYENVIRNGEVDSGENQYVVLGKWTTLRDDPNKPFSALKTTVGLGSGRFRSQQNVDLDNDGVNIFGSVALRVVAPVSLVADSPASLVADSPRFHGSISYGLNLKG